MNRRIFPLIPLFILLFLPTSLADSTSYPCENVRFAINKCQYIKDNCDLENFGLIDYLSFYYCSDGGIDSSAISKSWSLSIIILWLCILFMTIGIAAYDFLCPNLSTMANMLGLAESVVGVTFLAFGNGAPDMFSTYAAVKIGSGSLAVGELIGAATFIIAVVAGSMAVINPFRVSRAPFVRDMTFFTIALSFSLYFISDGILLPWECFVMLFLYVVYGALVVYWQMRHNARKQRRLTEDNCSIRSRQSRRIESITEDEVETEEEQRQPRPSLEYLVIRNSENELTSPTELRRRSPSPVSSITHSIYEEEEEQDEEEGNELSEITRIMRINRRKQPHYHTMDEENINPDDRTYRRLLASSRHSSRRSSPDSRHPSVRSRSRSPSPIPPVRSSVISAVEFHNIASRISSHRQLHLLSEGREGLLENQRTASYDRINTPPPPRLSLRALSAPYVPISPTTPTVKASIPSLLITQHDVEATASIESSPTTTTTPIRPTLTISTTSPLVPSEPAGAEVIEEIEQLYNYKDELAAEQSEVFRVLFPSLVNLPSKIWYNAISSILAVPSILILTCTVPIFESTGTKENIEDIFTPDTPPIHPSRLTDEAEVEDESECAQSPFWLLIIQCLLSPFAFTFCVFGEFNMKLFSLCCLSSILLLGCLFIVMINKHTLPLISFVGFSVVIVWIATIASEVVAVLKALGIIFNVSEAILGLTVFAIGNSLGDLITDITLARLGFPTMALAACFGSPLLNILVGIGMSCLVVMLGPSNLRPDLGRGGSYSIEVSSTLVVSGVTLLFTSFFLLIVVPLNNWRMSRAIGLCTISFWIISTTIMIVMEFKN